MGPASEVDPAVVIQRIHDLGAQLGFSRIRIDRSQVGGASLDRPAHFFEVGYASGEIHVRTSHGMKYRASVDNVDDEVVLAVLLKLLDEDPLS